MLEEDINSNIHIYFSFKSVLSSQMYFQQKKSYCLNCFSWRARYPMTKSFEKWCGVLSVMVFGPLTMRIINYIKISFNFFSSHGPWSHVRQTSINKSCKTKVTIASKQKIVLIARTMKGFMAFIYIWHGHKRTWYYSTGDLCSATLISNSISSTRILLSRVISTLEPLNTTYQLNNVMEWATR